MKRKLANREEKFLDILQANPTINSGATMADADGLMIFENPFNNFGDTKITVEIKCTDNKSFSVKPDILKKLKKQAEQINTVPLLAVDVQENRYVVMEVQDFMAIIAYVVELNNTKNFIDFVETSYDGEVKH